MPTVNDWLNDQSNNEPNTPDNGGLESWLQEQSGPPPSAPPGTGGGVESWLADQGGAPSPTPSTPSEPTFLQSVGDWIRDQATRADEKPMFPGGPSMTEWTKGNRAALEGAAQTVGDWLGQGAGEIANMPIGRTGETLGESLQQIGDVAGAAGGALDVTPVLGGAKAAIGEVVAGAMPAMYTGIVGAEALMGSEDAKQRLAAAVAEQTWTPEVSRENVSAALKTAETLYSRETPALLQIGLSFYDPLYILGGEVYGIARGARQASELRTMTSVIAKDSPELADEITRAFKATQRGSEDAASIIRTTRDHILKDQLTAEQLEAELARRATLYAHEVRTPGKDWKWGDEQTPLYIPKSGKDFVEKLKTMNPFDLTRTGLTVESRADGMATRAMSAWDDIMGRADDIAERLNFANMMVSAQGRAALAKTIGPAPLSRSGTELQLLLSKLTPDQLTRTVTTYTGGGLEGYGAVNGAFKAVTSSFFPKPVLDVNQRYLNTIRGAISLFAFKGQYAYPAQNAINALMDAFLKGGTGPVKVARAGIDLDVKTRLVTRWGIPGGPKAAQSVGGLAEQPMKQAGEKGLAAISQANLPQTKAGMVEKYVKPNLPMQLAQRGESYFSEKAFEAGADRVYSAIARPGVVVPNLPSELNAADAAALKNIILANPQGVKIESEIDRLWAPPEGGIVSGGAPPTAPTKPGGAPPTVPSGPLLHQHPPTSDLRSMDSAIADRMEQFAVTANTPEEFQKAIDAIYAELDQKALSALRAEPPDMRAAMDKVATESGILPDGADKLPLDLDTRPFGIPQVFDALSEFGWRPIDADTLARTPAKAKIEIERLLNTVSEKSLGRPSLEKALTAIQAQENGTLARGQKLRELQDVITQLRKQAGGGTRYTGGLRERLGLTRTTAPTTLPKVSTTRTLNTIEDLQKAATPIDQWIPPRPLASEWNAMFHFGETTAGIGRTVTPLTQLEVAKIGEATGGYLRQLETALKKTRVPLERGFPEIGERRRYLQDLPKEITRQVDVKNLSDWSADLQGGYEAWLKQRLTQKRIRIPEPGDITEVFPPTPTRVEFPPEEIGGWTDANRAAKVREMLDVARARGDSWMDALAELYQKRTEFVWDKLQKGGYSYPRTTYYETEMERRLKDADAVIRTLTGGKKGFDYEQLAKPYQPTAKISTQEYAIGYAQRTGQPIRGPGGGAPAGIAPNRPGEISPAIRPSERVGAAGGGTDVIALKAQQAALHAKVNNRTATPQDIKDLRGIDEMLTPSTTSAAEATAFIKELLAKKRAAEKSIATHPTRPLSSPEKASLKSLGYRATEVMRMTPERAREVIQSGLRNISETNISIAKYQPVNPNLHPTARMTAEEARQFTGGLPTPPPRTTLAEARQGYRGAAVHDPNIPTPDELLGNVPPIRYSQVVRAESDALMNEVKRIEDWVVSHWNDQPPAPPRVPPPPVGGGATAASQGYNARAIIQKWLKEEDVLNKVGNARAMALKAGEANRNFVLHDPSGGKYNLDTIIARGIPFHFWVTREGISYLKFLMRNPQFAHAWSVMMEQLEEINQDVPENYRHMLGIDTPWGRKYLNIEAGFNPINRTAAYLGGLTGLQAEKTRAGGTLPQQVLAKSFQYLRPVPPVESVLRRIGWLPPGLSEETGRVGTQTTQANVVQDFTAWIKQAHPDWGISNVIPPGGLNWEQIPANLIQSGMQAIGFKDFHLSAENPYDPTRIGREIINLASQGKITDAQAREALYAQRGPIWDQAFTSAYSTRASNDITYFLTSLRLSTILPSEKEIEAARLKAEKIFEQRDAGVDVRAQFDAFSKEFPWYFAYNSRYDSAEVRAGLEVKDIFYELRKLDQRVVRDALGDVFEKWVYAPTGSVAEFLGTAAPKATQSQLATWLAKLDALAPAGILPDPATAPYAKATKAMSDAYDEWVARYKAVADVEAEYYNKPVGAARKAYLDAHPELKAYFDWNARFWASHQDLATLIKRPPSQPATPAPFTGTGGGGGGSRRAFQPRQPSTRAPSGFNLSMLGSAYAALRSYWLYNSPLPSAAITILMDLFRRYPMGARTFMQWLLVVRRMAGV